MRTLPLVFLRIATAALIAAVLVFSPQVFGLLSRSDPGPSMEAGVPDLLERMQSLEPSDPMAYFELAEELAYLSVVSPNQRRTAVRMAEQLYVLAYELDKGSGAQSTLGASVCFGLADIAPTTERDWLLALAASFGSARGVMIGGERDQSGDADHARFDAAEALGRYRAVERRPLAAIMRRTDVREQMIRAGVDPRDADWAAGLLAKGLDRPFCPECRNQRLARTGTSDQSIEQTLCGTCFGNPEPEPPLSTEELRRMLAIEAELLGASPRSWSAQSAIGGWRPIPDLDPSGLAERYGVDPDRPYWVPESRTALIGEWSAEPGGSSE